MKLLSVNVAHPRSASWGNKEKPELTGIDKHPTSEAVGVTAPGPKGTGKTGIAGDRVYDKEHHGGDDQAVYAYAREDYDYWERELGRELRGGMFGENLTVEGLNVTGALIGERWRVGADVVLEVSCPRIPCGTFRGWMDEKGWLKTFTAAGKPGAYLRVIAPGEIRAGDSVSIESRPDHDVTIALTFRAARVDKSLLPRLLAADALPEEIKQAARKAAEGS
ncbi:MAG: MOSC domain-containing protein [Stackebrandtia sp.]